MTIFGVIWVVMLAVAMYKNDWRILVAMVILSATLQCDNVFVIAGMGVGPQIFTSIVFVIFSMIYNLKGSMILKINKKKTTLIMLLLFLVIVVLVSSWINDCLGSNYIYVIQLLMYVICTICMYRVGEVVGEDLIYKIVRNITIFILIMGVIQLLSTSNKITRIGFINVLFFNDKVSNAIVYYIDDYHRICATFMEPSYFAGYVVGAFYYLFSFKEERKSNIVLFGALLVELLLSFSSTAYGAFCIVGLLYVVLSKEWSMKFYISVGGVLVFYLMYTKFYNILDSVIFNKMKSGSAVARNAWNNEAIRVFKESPIIGSGYKSQRASSVIFTLLAEEGIIGLAVYGLLNIRILLSIVFSKKYGVLEHERAICFAILSVVVGQIIAVPDIDNCTYWMWMNCLMLCLGARDSVISQQNRRNKVSA
jgi:hypothetical protein